MKRGLSVLVFCLVFFGFPVVALAQTHLRSGPVVSLSSNETVNKDYFAAGKNVSLDGSVNGDAYLAGGDVTVNGVVNGDLLAAGGNININGVVTGNIRAVGGNININGKVGRNISVVGGSINALQNASVLGSVTAAGGNINILSPIAKDLVLAGGQVHISGSIKGDVNAGVGQLTLSSGAKVGGNIVYWSNNKADINPAASVSGTITQNLPPQKAQPRYPTTGKAPTGILVAFNVISFLTALVIGLLLIKLLPEFTGKITTGISSRWLPGLGVGLLALAATPFLVILLLISVVGIPVAFIWLIFILIDLWLAKIFVALSLGLALMRYFKKTWSMHWTYVFGLLVYYLIGLIPLIGSLFGFVAAAVGLGAIILTKKNYYLELRKKRLI